MVEIGHRRHDETVAVYWQHHCEHRRPFRDLDEAFRFLRSETDSHNIAGARISDVSGSILLSHEEFHRMRHQTTAEIKSYLGRSRRRPG